MAVTWIADHDTDIPQDEIGYSVSEETTDGKLTALYYTPEYRNPQDDTDILKGDEIKVTDAAKLKAFQNAQSEGAEDAYDFAKPTFSLTGTHYRASTGKDPVGQQEADAIVRAQEKAMAQCNNYTGAQRDACMQLASQQIEQMKKVKGFAEGGLVRQEYAEGGEVMSVPEEQMQAMLAQEQMMPPMPKEEVMPVEQEDNLDMVERIASVLSQEEMAVLNEALDMHPQLVVILDKAMDAISTTGEFEGEGPVNGPGTETSDSIPARLSDGEFVFTAKAVKQLGVDKLRKMMAKAEDDYDTAMYKQEGNQMEAAGNEEGYFLGGLLDQTRKQWGNLESATAEYQQPMERTVPTNIDGMGRELPESQTGIMGRRTIDLAAQQRDQSGKQQMNTNTQSTAPAAAAASSLMSAVNMNVEEQRDMEQQQLTQNAQEPEDEQSLMG